MIMFGWGAYSENPVGHFRCDVLLVHISRYIWSLQAVRAKTMVAGLPRVLRFQRTGAKKCQIMAGNYMRDSFVVSTFFLGSGLQTTKPRRPARVKVSSFDVRTTLRSRQRSGELLSAVKVDNHGSYFRIFDFRLEIYGCSHKTGPADPVYILMTQRCSRTPC